MRHIKRYEEFETYPYQEPVPEPKYELKDPVLDATPYPREEDEDRSYERTEWMKNVLYNLGFSHALVAEKIANGTAAEFVYNHTGETFDNRR